MVYSLGANNDLKVQETGEQDAGLDELQEEFSDGK